MRTPVYGSGFILLFFRKERNIEDGQTDRQNKETQRSIMTTKAD
jgi:hypothetical protein